MSYTVKKRKLSKKGHTRKFVNPVKGPIYPCGVCHKECKDLKLIVDDLDNSVGCDKCYKWFHWGCVGFDGLDDEDWLCEDCS